jgi:hypothetical protein
MFGSELQCHSFAIAQATVNAKMTSHIHFEFHADVLSSFAT